MVPSLFSSLLAFHHQLIQLVELADDRLSLQQTQALKSLLDQFLYSAFLCGVLVLAERIPCLPTSIFAEVVVGKLSGIAQKGAEQRSCLEGSLMMQGRDRHDSRCYDNSMERIQTVIRVEKPKMRSAGRLLGQPQVITKALVARSTRGCCGKKLTLGAMTRINDAIGGGGSILQEPQIRGY